MSLVLAVDGGNTKTIAVIADSDGRVLGVGTGGCSDIYGAGSVEAGLGVLVSTVDAAIDVAGVHGAGFAASVFSLAGADWPEDIELITSELRSKLALVEPLVVNDSIGGLRSGSPNWEGIAVICGTFNAVGARNTEGRVFHLGFWPDRTGAFDLSVAALKAVYREGLGLGPATRLTERALALYGAADPLDLLHSFTRRDHKRGMSEIVRMTPALFDVADEGDGVAREIVAHAGHMLGAEARISAERVDLPLEGAKVVLSGGVLNHPSTLLVDAIMSCLPGAHVVRAAVPPIVGAVLIAFDQIGVSTDGGDLRRQIDSMSIRAPS